LSELDRRLIDAFDRLAGGRSETTDGALTVTNLCAEARVSRASHYRSPVAAVVKTLLASDQTPRPEVEQLRWLTAPDGRAACRAVNSEDC
jgi:hypothetical protein